MGMLANTMLADGLISWLEIIESARIPVMKIRSQACGLRADIVFNESSGFETSLFVKQRMQEIPHMRYLLVFLKYFLMQRGLNDTFTGGMGSYLLCNVVLHFLQQHPSMKNQQRFQAMSLGHFLFDFFKYYGRDFKYDCGISVLNGGYTFRKEEKFPSKGKGKGGPALCLESPLGATSIDLGGPCFRMGVLRNLFHHGFHCLSQQFVKRPTPEEGSLICPLLLDPAHAVITSRFALMSEQPAALSKVQVVEDSPSRDSIDDAPRQPSPSEQDDAVAVGEPPERRARLS